MKRTNALAAISDALTGFQTELQRLALQIVEDVMRREAERHQARSVTKRKPGRPAKEPKELPPAIRRKRGRPSKAQQQLDLLAAAEAAAPVEAASSTSSAAAAPSGEPQQTQSAVFSGKRRQWTRESITEELANWLVSGNSTDASFVTRHGPPGLAAAARRVFGRFDAALNVAGLHVAKLYPDGPPPKRGAAVAAMKVPRGPRPKPKQDQATPSVQQASE